MNRKSLLIAAISWMSLSCSGMVFAENQTGTVAREAAVVAKSAKPSNSPTKGKRTASKKNKQAKVLGPYKRTYIPIGYAPVKGSKNALVTIVGFFDFQCKFSGQAQKTMGQLVKKYKGKVRLVFKHMPLSTHKNAHLAAQAAMIAHVGRKFWKYHDVLFQNPNRLQQNDLIAYAAFMGLNHARFSQGLKGQAFKKYIDLDLAMGYKVGAKGTPTFFVNGRKVLGAQSYKHFAKIVDQEVALAKKLLKMGTARDLLYGTATGKYEIGLKNIGYKTIIPRGVSLKGSPSIGPKGAPVTIVEFSDFECFACGRGSKIMKQVRMAYGNKVRIVFKHYPLSFHRNAHKAAQAAMAAHEQGKFWPYHDLLFANFRSLGEAAYIKFAKRLGLDMKKFKKALDSAKYKSFVDADMKQARIVGLQGTPNFFVNGVQINGAVPFPRFKKIIDAALKKAVRVPLATPPKKPAKSTKPAKRTAPAIKHPTPPKARKVLKPLPCARCPKQAFSFVARLLMPCKNASQTIKGNLAKWKHASSGKTVKVSTVALKSGSNQGRIAVQLTLAGDFNGSIVLEGTPTLQNDQLKLIKLHLNQASEKALQTQASWLKGDVLVQSLKPALTWSFSRQFTAFKKAFGGTSNKGTGLRMNMKLQKTSIQSIGISKTLKHCHIKGKFQLEGQLQLGINY